jgi:N-acetyl-gamma-glutamyl-phosphate reductase
MHTAASTPGADASGTPAGAPAARVAVAGATGYTGQELVRILARHPSVRLTVATSSGSGTRRLPALSRLWEGTIAPLDVDVLVRDADLVFLAMPDTAAAELAPRLLAQGMRVIDLSGAFRLRNPEVRARWYPESPELPEGTAYGLTELERDSVRRARLVANPGCYPTAALLAIVPLIAAGLLVKDADIIVDAKSGVSGAGKTPSERTHFSEVHGSLSAYGVLGHRHGAEIDQGLGVPATFTPHLLPLDRGILETIYVRVAPGTTTERIGEVFEQAYASEPFVRVTGAELPEIKHVAHTNFCDIGWRIDVSGRLVLISVIDNLLKGASGQAVQNMNVMLGLPESSGLL